MGISSANALRLLNFVVGWLVLGEDKTSGAWPRIGARVELAILFYGSIDMNKRAIVFFLAFAMFFSLAFSSRAGDFTADLVDVDEDEVTQRMYVSGDKVRFDTVDEDEPGNNSTAIILFDAGKFFMLIPEAKKYVEIPLDGGVDNLDDFHKSMMPEGTTITRESMGKETVNGYETEKFRVTSVLNILDEPVSMVAYEWIAPEFAPHPVRIQDTVENFTLEMRNIKTGPVDPTVFEVPEGYERDTATEAMMKGAAGE